jgi:hypothetical protein
MSQPKAVVDDKLIHVCLISDQLLPNLIPALMDRPAIVYLIVTPEMAGQAERLDALLQQEGVAVRRCANAPGIELKAVIAFATTLADAIRAEHPDRRIVLNATGGTKPMSMGFMMVFGTRLGAEVIYADTTHDTINSLNHLDSAPRAMRPVLGLRNYLAANGFRVDGAKSEDPEWCLHAEAREEATRYLVRHIDKFQSLFSLLNSLARAAMDNRGARLVQPVQSYEPMLVKWRRTRLQSADEAALQVLERNGLFTRDGVNVSFNDADAARYCGGLWLEEYAWHALRKVHLDELAIGVSGRWQIMAERDPANELDVLIVNRNRLLFIECKTSRFGRDDAKDQDIVLKAESLGRSLGGPLVSRMLLSATKMQESALSRALTHGIHVVQAAQVKSLDAEVAHWRKHGRLRV